MAAVSETFDLSNILEYTVEAGRPDTITAEKLKVIKKNGASRISVNPQTMNDETLRLIGRKHTVCLLYTSVIYHPDGSVNNYFYGKIPAEHIFINTKIIAESPEHMFWAGIGDAISKELEAQLAIRGHKADHTPLMGNQLSLISVSYTHLAWT